jgi:hypothetical protein
MSSYRTWLQLTFQRGAHSPPWKGCATCIAGLLSWSRVHSYHTWGDLVCPFFERFSSWTSRSEATSWAVYLGSPADNKLCRLIRLGLRKVLLVRAEWSAVRPARKLTRRFSGRGWRFSIHSNTVEFRRGMMPGSWRAEWACETWLWLPCCSRWELAGRGGIVWGYRWHWEGEDRLDQTTLRHPCPHASTWLFMEWHS